ncbi:MAG TPA: inositol monophosphatase family protein, partial [Acidimicrobiia bacterium]|nr:inositol monophosphatase family protein [Acidimicrobiia bacterium]
AALNLCDLAAGAVDGLVDGGAWHAPWDYLGGLLVCREAGAVVVDAAGRELVVVDPDARRQLLAAATPALLEELRRALPDPGRPVGNVPPPPGSSPAPR